MSNGTPIWSGRRGYEPFSLTDDCPRHSLLAGIVIAACYFPARTAMRIDPVVALHSE